MRVVVIGGDAAGMSAASQVKRLQGADVTVTVLNEQSWTSYSACGIPYWIGGEADGPDALVARTPEEHRTRGIDVRTGMRATAIDPERHIVTAESVIDGAVEDFEYDHLVLATGARPVAPPIPGLDLPGVFRVHTLDQAQAAIDALARRPSRAVILGAGYIGVEMAEACLNRDLHTTIVDRAAEPLVLLDPDMGALVRAAMVDRGVVVEMGESVRRIVAGPDGRVAQVVTDSKQIDADIVFLGLGVRPRSELAEAAGLPLGEWGGILVDERQQVLGHDTIWAGGDCVEVTDRLTGHRRFVPLGTHANKHGRVIGLNLGGEPATFPGVIGTAITKFCDVEISRTGLLSTEATAAVSVVIDTSTAVGYLPDAGPMTVKMIADPATRRVLGVQIVGAPSAGLRIDSAATAIWNGMTVDDIIGLDLAYAPPYTPVWSPIQTAARALLSQLAGPR